MSFWNKSSAIKSTRRAAVEKKPARPVVSASIKVPPDESKLRTMRAGLALSLIFEAARDGELEDIRSLLQENPNLSLDQSNYRGTTPLHAAADKGHKVIVELLLNHKADVNAVNRSGATPLHVAALKGRAEVVDLLISRGADVSARNGYGATPLHLAAGKGKKEIVEALLQHGADPNARDNDGATALHYIANEAYVGRFFLHQGVFEALVAHGANVNTMDSQHQTPLHTAASRGLIDMVRQLLINQANVNASCYGRTPLAYAQTAGGHRDVEDILREFGGKPAINSMD